MSKINVNDVMALRQKSGLGVMECKAALEKANGDMAIAEINIRKDGLSKMDGRIDRDASDGCIAVAVTDDMSKCAIVEINTETDFTAKNDGFVAMAIEIAQLALRQPAPPMIVSSLGAYLPFVNGPAASFGFDAVFGREMVGQQPVLLPLLPPGMAMANSPPRNTPFGTIDARIIL